MPNLKKIDKILNDVRRKVANHAYIPKSVKKKSTAEIRETDCSIVLTPKK